MRTIDENNNEIDHPDLSLGRLEPDTILIAHHSAIEAVAEQGHWDTVAEYPNGGRDVAWVVDVPAVDAVPAWDEYEDVMRYIPYTQEELDEIAARAAAEEEARKKAEEEAEAERKLAEARNAIIDGAPARFDSVESTQLDHDEAIAVLYESMTQAQLDTDEALVTIYEMMSPEGAMA